VPLVALLATGCGSAAPPELHGDPTAYLLTLDQLPSPDFTVYMPAAAAGAGWLDPASTSAVQDDGLVEAAEVEYYRGVPFATSDGPITLTVAAARFTGAGGAAAAVSRLDSAVGARSGAVQATTSSPPGGRAVTIEGSLEGVQAVEIVLLWRVENVVNSLDAEGRAGGLALEQLIPLAETQTANEQGT
jgi:hypothetical protein